MLQILVNGLLVGGIYALVAVGLTMNYGVMKIVNFAHGDFLTVGIYASYVLFPLLGINGIPYYMIPAIGIITYLIGWLVFRYSLYHVIGKDESAGIILTMGLSFLVQNIIQLIFTASFLAFPVNKGLQHGKFTIGGVYLLWPRLIAFGVAVIFVIIIFWFLNKTDMGRAMRATSESTTVAHTLGINTKKVFSTAFCIGVALAGIAGLLFTPIFFAYPKVGMTFTTMAMSSIVLGGLGNIVGALVGGLIIGLIESVISTLISVDLALIVNSAVLILILLIKPYGLFGGGVRKA